MKKAAPGRGDERSGLSRRDFIGATVVAGVSGACGETSTGMNAGSEAVPDLETLATTIEEKIEREQYS